MNIVIIRIILIDRSNHVDLLDKRRANTLYLQGAPSLPFRLPFNQSSSETERATRKKGILSDTRLLHYLFVHLKSPLPPTILLTYVNTHIQPGRVVLQPQRVVVNGSLPRVEGPHVAVQHVGRRVQVHPSLGDDRGHRADGRAAALRPGRVRRPGTDGAAARGGRVARPGEGAGGARGASGRTGRGDRPLAPGALEGRWLEGREGSEL